MGRLWEWGSHWSWKKHRHFSSCQVLAIISKPPRWCLGFWFSGPVNLAGANWMFHCNILPSNKSWWRIWFMVHGWGEMLNDPGNQEVRGPMVFTTFGRFFGVPFPTIFLSCEFPGAHRDPFVLVGKRNVISIVGFILPLRRCDIGNILKASIYSGLCTCIHCVTLHCVTLDYVMLQ